MLFAKIGMDRAVNRKVEDAACPMMAQIGVLRAINHGEPKRKRAKLYRIVPARPRSRNEQGGEAPSTLYIFLERRNQAVS
jgi:hypothetical protein